MGKAESVRGGTGNGGLGRADGSALQDFGKQQPVMATVRRQNRHGGKRVYNRSSSSAGGGREAEGGREAGEGFPDFALSPLCSGGAPGLGSAADPPSPALLVGGAHLVYGEGYSSSALVIKSLILRLHPCGMPT